MPDGTVIVQQATNGDRPIDNVVVVNDLGTPVYRQRVHVANLDDVKRGITDYEARLDYDASNNLIYAGKAPNGSATTWPGWVIQKLSYTGANLTRVQVLAGSWDGRVGLAW